LVQLGRYSAISLERRERNKPGGVARSAGQLSVILERRHAPEAQIALGPPKVEVRPGRPRPDDVEGAIAALPEAERLQTRARQVEAAQPAATGIVEFGKRCALRVHPFVAVD
jgi:hypothetical protein